MSSSPPISTKPLRPILCRVGSKAKFAKMLNNLVPPHSTYVEPFVGSGAVFFYKDPVQKEVINDLNKGIVETYKLIQKIPVDATFPTLTSFESMRRFFNQDPRTDTDKLAWRLIEACGGWMSIPATREWLATASQRVKEKGEGVVRVINPSDKLKHFDAYKARLDGVVITNEDYEKVMKKYDSKDTFFFCDPPYEGTSSGIGYAQQNEFDFERFAKVCKQMKGKVVVTLNDSPNIRELFKGWNFAGILISKSSKQQAKATTGSKTRKEVVIANFSFPSGWSEGKPQNVKIGKGCGCEDSDSEDENGIVLTLEGEGKKDFTMSESAYLREARKRAKKAGYNDPLFLSDEEEHKLMIVKPNGKKVHFGRKGYGDFILWSHAEKEGKVPKGYAEMKQRVFQISHSAIKGDWKKDKYSPNNLALKINW